MIVIGLGTGRCGTKSLSSLLNMQKNAVFFHEMLVTQIMFESTEWPIISTINEFQDILDGGDQKKIHVDFTDDNVLASYKKLTAMQSVKFIGDIASYYLKYVPIILHRNRDVKFICMRRNKRDTIKSFIDKVTIKKSMQRKLMERVVTLMTGRRYQQAMNHWINHDGTVWQHGKFDNMFPKFNAPDMASAIGQYWDMYYQEAELLQRIYPEKLQIFELDELNNNEGIKKMLIFAGFNEKDIIYKTVHDNKNQNVT